MNAQRRIDVYTRDRATLTPHQRRRVVHKARGKERAVALALIAALVVGATSCGGGARRGDARDPVGGTHTSPAHNYWKGFRGPTTTTAPPAPPHTQVPPLVSRSRPPAVSRGGGAGGGDAWGCIRKYESGGTTDPRGSNDHRDGYYQIIPSTWANGKGGYHASDGKVYPTAQSAPYAIQTERAHQIQARSGWSQWSTARRCGLV